LTRPQVSLAIVGANHPNKRGPTRRFGIALLQPGDPVEILREPKNRFDEFAITVVGPDDIQLGYVRSERAAWLAPIMDRGEDVTAVFQEATEYGCVVRAAFGGELPTLPPPREPAEEPDWWPDEEWPD
jgi:hypothetical protein